jgi:hypothetical protein
MYEICLFAVALATPLFHPSLDATSLASRVLAHPFSKKAPAHVVAGERLVNHS